MFYHRASSTRTPITHASTRVSCECVHVDGNAEKLKMCTEKGIANVHEYQMNDIIINDNTQVQMEAERCFSLFVHKRRRRSIR